MTEAFVCPAEDEGNILRLSSTKGQCDTIAPHYQQDTEVPTKIILWWMYRQNRAEFKTEQSEALWRLTVGLKTAREVREGELMGSSVSFKKQSQFSMEIDWPRGNLINFFLLLLNYFTSKRLDALNKYHATLHRSETMDLRLQDENFDSLLQEYLMSGRRFVNIQTTENQNPDS